MHAGIPLTDADREPWLGRVAAWIDGQRAMKQPGIISCSALKLADKLPRQRRARLMAARSSQDFACCWRATACARAKILSVSTVPFWSQQRGFASYS